MWIFWLMEGEDGALGLSDHPPAGCRMYKLTKTLNDGFLDSEGALEGLKRMGMTKAEFQKSLAALSNECKTD
jgi:hypothetical protein